MRGPIDVLFAFKIFSLPVPTRPNTQTFLQVPDPSRPEVKNPYPSDPGQVGYWVYRGFPGTKKCIFFGALFWFQNVKFWIV